jgi:ABC-type transport system involved in cytochrome bd biosynthesis fused ATPase/permease subunit
LATVRPRSGVTPLPRLTLAAALATPQKRRSAAKMRLGRDSVLGAGEHMTALLRVRGLVVDFNTEQGLACAVNGASFDLNKGEIVALVGESGCGKSVTALAILRHNVWSLDFKYARYAKKLG